MASRSPGCLGGPRGPSSNHVDRDPSLRDWLGEPLARGLRGLTGGFSGPAPVGVA